MFKIKFKLDKDSFVKASLFTYRYELSKSPKRFLGFIFILMSQFGVVSLLRTGQVGLLLLSSLLLIYWYFLREKIRKKIYEKSFKDEVDFTLVVDENSIKINNIDLNLNDISEVVEFKEGFILYYKNQSIFIPKQIFSDEQREKFISILNKNLKIVGKNITI